MTPKQGRALDQLNISDLVNYVVAVATYQEGWRGRMRPSVLLRLRGDPRFHEGPFWWLHQEIGSHLTEFRSEEGAFSPEGAPKESLQIVVGQQPDSEGTLPFYCDVDRFCPYEDEQGRWGHLILEVFWPWLKGLWGRRPGEADRG